MATTPRYTLWEAVSASLSLSMQALKQARVPGPKGADGERGPPGFISPVKTWTDSVHYEGAIVTLDGSTFQALRDTGKKPPHEDWACLAFRGRDGRDAKQPVVRGTYNVSEAYENLNIVMLNGASFIATQDDPGPCPGDGWQLFAQQGRTGKPGERGPKGDTGKPGADGATIAALELDDEGRLSIALTNGVRFTCDFYPILERIAR